MTAVNERIPFGFLQLNLLFSCIFFSVVFLGAFGGGQFFLVGFFALLLFILFRFSPFRGGWLLYVFFLIYFVKLLEVPLVDWDARSIWFFHAKRIAISGDFWVQLDDYASWSHNDYPPLLPVIAAQVGRLFGVWNEVLPKLSLFVLIVPPLLAVSLFFRDLKTYFAWLGVLVLICGRYVHNGYADALLAIYFSALLLVLSRLYAVRHLRSPSLGELFSVFFLSVFLLLLKNEGVVAFAAVTLSVCLCGLSFVVFLPLCFSFVVYLVLWKVPVLYFGVSSDLLSHGVWASIYARLSDVDSILLIFDSFRTHGLVCVGLLWLVFVLDLGQNLKIFSFCILFYVLALFCVYLLTPNDLAWHLQTSVGRVFIAPALAIVSLVLYRFLGAD